MHVLITGANRGIGAALAAAHRASGHDVTGTSRGDGADIRLDVTRPGDHADMASTLSGKPIDLLICNAGVYLDKGENLETGFAPEKWAETFAANVTGVFLTIQTLLPNVRAAEGPGKIAIISSQMASQTRAPGGSYIYRASKAAVLNLGRNLASDLRGDGIAVGNYHPGWVQTDMGGAAADITVDEAVAGLVERFAQLDMERSGCFETWDGRDHPF